MELQDLIDKAKEMIARSQLERARRMAGRVPQTGEPNQTGIYQDYEDGTHTVLVDGNPVSVSRTVSNAGQKRGDRVLVQAGHFDAMPRTKPSDPIDPVLGEDVKDWGLLVRHLKITGYRTEFSSGSSAIWTPAAPASYGVMFYTESFPSRIRNRNFVGMDAPNRYTLGWVRDISGSNFPGAAFSRDYDFLCRANYGNQWRFCPLDLETFTRTPGGRPRRDLQFTARDGITEDGRILYTGTSYVIGALLFASDGESAGPNLNALPQKPRFWRKVLNPANALAGGVSSSDTWVDGERYLDCDEAKGKESIMEWQFLEIIPFTEYRPPVLVSQARPPQFVQRPNYAEEYWLHSNAGLVKICEIPVEGGGQVQANLSLDESGIFHADFRTSRFIEEEDFREEITLTHYQIKQGAVSKVDSSVSWRAPLTNAEDYSPAPGERHPCSDAFFFDRTINLFLQAQKIIKITALPNDGSEPRFRPSPPITDILKYSVHRLPPADNVGCTLGLQDAPQEKEQRIPRLDPTAIQFEEPRRGDPLRPDPRRWEYMIGVIQD